MKITDEQIRASMQAINSQIRTELSLTKKPHIRVASHVMQMCQCDDCLREYALEDAIDANRWNRIDWRDTTQIRAEKIMQWVAIFILGTIVLYSAL